MKLWVEFYTELKNLKLSKHLVIYSHNLGSFDGYFILQSLFLITDNPKTVKMLIDNRNKFITISHTYSIMVNINKTNDELLAKGLKEEDKFKETKYKWSFLDSYRLFPQSLENLANMFGCEGKISEYNKEWNNIAFLDNEEELNKFIEYAKQDSISLLLALIKARETYLEKYSTDITKVVSSPSLSLLIYRNNFQLINIPILKRDLDNKIRASYYGGSSDYYYRYGQNIYYYDVNSLYPYVMLNDMPLIYKGETRPFGGWIYHIRSMFRIYWSNSNLSWRYPYSIINTQIWR